MVLPESPRFGSFRDFFNGNDLNVSISPDEAITYGAAVQEDILSEDKSEDVQDLLFSDVSPHSLGTETDDGVMTVFTEHNAIMPIQQTDL